MKMYGYVAKSHKKSLYVREDHLAPAFWKDIVSKHLGITAEAAEEYIKNNYNVVEIEYNEVT